MHTINIIAINRKLIIPNATSENPIDSKIMVNIAYNMPKIRLFTELLENREMIGIELE